MSWIWNLWSCELNLKQWGCVGLHWILVDHSGSLWIILNHRRLHWVKDWINHAPPHNSRLSDDICGSGEERKRRRRDGSGEGRAATNFQVRIILPDTKRIKQWLYIELKLWTIKAPGTTVTIFRTYHTFSSDCEASFNQGDYNCLEVSCFSFERHFNNISTTCLHLNNIWQKRQLTRSSMPLTMDGPMVERFQAGLFSNLQKVVNGNVDCDGNAGLNIPQDTR